MKNEKWRASTPGARSTTSHAGFAEFHSAVDVGIAARRKLTRWRGEESRAVEQ